MPEETLDALSGLARSLGTLAGKGCRRDWCAGTLEEVMAELTEDQQTAIVRHGLPEYALENFTGTFSDFCYDAIMGHLIECFEEAAE
jgi:hypothetical protein